MHQNPNIIYILADDMGCGDVACYHERGKINTPNLDRIAQEGLRFTNAHATSAVCTPSRYSILTGRYCWRTFARGVLPVYGAPLIPPERLTVASLLKQAGYHTACFGKWHLGMGFCKNESGEPDFTKPLTGGPIANGFDTYFGVDMPNWPPYAFIEGQTVLGEQSAYYRKTGGVEDISIDGPGVPDWSLEQVLPTITDKACAYIDSHAEQAAPFFMYFSLTSPHTPLCVNDAWKGKSGLGLYADFVMETDAMVGRVLDALDENHLADDTLVIFATDNGCARYIGCDDLERQGHYPSGNTRGYKADAWDGGHRVPLLMRWPAGVQAGQVCEQLVSLGDFMATAAALTDQSLPDNAGEDSVSLLPILKGNNAPVRESMIQHSFSGKFAVRKGDKKLILCAGSGGFVWEDGSGFPPDAQAAQSGLPRYQLYNLADDPCEQTNLYPQEKETAHALLAILQQAVACGRTTPGATQKNDIPCVLDPETGGAPMLDDA